MIKKLNNQIKTAVSETVFIMFTVGECFLLFLVRYPIRYVLDYMILIGKAGL